MKIALEVSPRKFAFFMLVLVAVVCFASLVANMLYIASGSQSDLVFRAVQFFSVEAERSIPTWYSSFALMCCAVLLALIAYQKGRVSDPYKWHWRGLTGIFVYLSLDEAVSLHEELDKVMESLLGQVEGLPYPWVIAGGFAVVIVGALFLRFWLHLPTLYRWLFVGAAALFVGGSIVFEVIGGSMRGSTLYTVMVHLEELFEMGGVVLFIFTLASYIRDFLPGLQVQVRDAERIPSMSRAVAPE